MLRYLLLFTLVLVGIDAKIPVNDSIRNIKLTGGVIETYEIWNRSLIQKLNAGSQVIATDSGPIEYSLKIPKCRQPRNFKPCDQSDSWCPQNLGPVVLVLHGGFGGYDQAEAIGDTLYRQGFTILCPSRPGYLRTPLSVGQTNAQQADAMVSLLDALGIDQVAVVGFSAGAQVAFEFATRFPNRTWALVMESLGNLPGQNSDYQLLTDLLELANGEVANFGSYLFYLFTRNYPLEAVAYITSQDNTLPADILANRIQFVLQNNYQVSIGLKFIYTTMPLEPRIPGLLNDIGSNLDPWYGYDYSALRAPTMIIEAKNDSNGSFAEARWVAKQIPGAEFIPVKASGHFIWLGGNAELWERKLKCFLAKHRPCHCNCSNQSNTSTDNDSYCDQHGSQHGWQD